MSCIGANGSARYSGQGHNKCDLLSGLEGSSQLRWYRGLSVLNEGGLFAASVLCNHYPEIGPGGL